MRGGMTSLTSFSRPRPQRHIADLFSLSNLLFGLVSIAWSLQGRYVFALFCVALGAVCDGLDGAAARKWGGTRLGVLADDVADAVTYGVAPSVALWSFLGGAEGVCLAVAYTAFTITRLAHFTLNKGKSEPGYFQGIPSTLGGMIVLAALVAWAEHPLLVATLVGGVCIKLVAFSTKYRHLGRWFASQRLRVKIEVVALALLLACWIALMPVLATSVLLLGAVAYCLWPSVREVVAPAG